MQGNLSAPSGAKNSPYIYPSLGIEGGIAPSRMFHTLKPLVAGRTPLVDLRAGIPRPLAWRGSGGCALHRIPASDRVKQETAILVPLAKQANIYWNGRLRMKSAVVLARDPNKLAAKSDLTVIRVESKRRTAAEHTADVIAHHGSKPAMPDSRSTGMQNIVVAMKSHGVRRLLSLAGAGGES